MEPLPLPEQDIKEEHHRPDAVDEKADLQEGKVVCQNAVDAHHQALAGSPQNQQKITRTNRLFSFFCNYDTIGEKKRIGEISQDKEVFHGPD